MGFSKISNGGLNLGNLWGFQLIALQFMLSKLLGFFFPVTFRDLQAVTGTPQGTLPSPPPLSLTAHLLARLSPSCLPELHMTQSSLSFSWDYLEAVPPIITVIASPLNSPKLPPLLYISAIATWQTLLVSFVQWCNVVFLKWHLLK